jgi:hypothetical protein
MRSSSSGILVRGFASDFATFGTCALGEGGGGGKGTFGGRNIAAALSSDFALTLRGKGGEALRAGEFGGEALERPRVIKCFLSLFSFDLNVRMKISYHYSSVRTGSFVRIIELKILPETDFHADREVGEGFGCHTFAPCKVG